MKTEFNPQEIAEARLNHEIEKQVQACGKWQTHELVDDRHAEHRALKQSRRARTIRISRHVLP